MFPLMIEPVDRCHGKVDVDSAPVSFLAVFNFNVGPEGGWVCLRA